MFCRTRDETTSSEILELHIFHTRGTRLGVVRQNDTKLNLKTPAVRTSLQKKPIEGSHHFFIGIFVFCFVLKPEERRSNGVDLAVAPKADSEDKKESTMTTKPAPPFKRPTGMSFVVQTATNNTSSSFDDTRPPNGSGVPFEVFDAGEHNGGGMSLNFVVIMGILVGAAILSLFMPLLIRHFRGCRCIEPEEQEEAAAPTTVPITKKQRKDRRYTEIESWLISREVVAHDEHCEKAITYLDSVAVNPKDEVKKRSDTAATDEEWGSESTDDEKECPVCMEVIAVGDIISWSPNTQCDHTFHHRCIKVRRSEPVLLPMRM